MNQITDQIWIGNSADARNADALRAAGINAILNCAFDLRSHLGWPEFLVAHCGLIDGPGNSLAAYRAGMHQLENLVGLGHKVLAHCHEGRSRSAFIVLCHLRASGVVDSLAAGQTYLFQRRPIVLIHQAHVEVYGSLFP